MKMLSSFAALSLAFVLALTPFALIAVDDAVAAKADVSTVAAASASDHASRVEGR